MMSKKVVTFGEIMMRLSPCRDGIAAPHIARPSKPQRLSPTFIPICFTFPPIPVFDKNPLYYLFILSRRVSAKLWIAI